MNFADDIALGKLSRADLNAISNDKALLVRPSQKVSSSPSLQLSFAISASFHFALAATLLFRVAGEVDVVKEALPPVLQIAFVPANSLLSPQEEAAVTEPAPAISLGQSVSIPAAVPEPPPQSSEADRPSIAETEIAEPREIASPPSLPAEIIALPSVESVRRVLSDVQRAETSQFYSYNCNKLEREKEFSRCTPLDDRNYAEISSNSVSEFYRPAVEVSRSRQTVTTLARHSDSVAGRLALNNLPPSLSAYVMEEIELSIETYSNTSSRTAGHMSAMVDKSAAGEMARRISAPWVQQQSAVLQARKASDRVDD
ncbi:MAG: hypothetical protein P8N94_05855 [Gammaproteobacteria bacterium]|nr:hypothetical protein [Gammaproteobacteria bacterium]MDG2337498.1 hypothetical protein [Gammaproteobacteria bacterium]